MPAFIPEVPLASSRIQGGIEPNVDPGYHATPQSQVITLGKQDMASELGRARHRDDDSDQLLARPVGRVRLAGENEHYRALGIGHDLAQPIQIFEQ